MRRFDVLRVATGSYTVESKRIASRKLFKRFPGLQDVKNGSKRTKIIEKSEKSDFAGFLAVFFGPIFPVGSAAWGASQGNYVTKARRAPKTSVQLHVLAERTVDLSAASYTG